MEIETKQLGKLKFNPQVYVELPPPFINASGKVCLRGAKLWQKAKLKARSFFVSKTWHKDEAGNQFSRAYQYVKPALPNSQTEIKGKLNLKYAQKQRVKAMKLAQSTGDNI